MPKVISIHQPETLPYAGFFNKMLEADEFIILDDVQFKKNNYQNRNKILYQGTPKWVTFPVDMKGRLNSTIRATKLADTVDWRARNSKLINDAYDKVAPYFHDHMPMLYYLLYNSSDSLVELNMSIIEYFNRCLDIDTPIVYSSELGITSSSTDLLVDICKARGATKYLSGAGGRDYLEVSKFEENGIEVLYPEFNPEITYYQYHKDAEFIPYLSVLDLLMNNSNKDAREYIANAFHWSK